MVLSHICQEGKKGHNTRLKESWTRETEIKVPNFTHLN